MAIVYVPALRWKRGEVRAVENLKNTTQRQIIPLIDLMPHAYDPAEDGGNDPALEERVRADARNLRRARRDRLAWVDLSDQDADARAGGLHLVDYFFRTASDENCAAVPVVRLGADDDYIDAVRSVAARDGRGAVIRIVVPEFEGDDYDSAITELVDELELERPAIDIVLDMRAEVIPIPAQSRVARAVLDDIPNIDDWRSIVLASGAFPVDLSGLAVGQNRIPRHDWHLWRHVSDREPARQPIYGDYTVRHPELADDFDPRLVNMSASVRYTLDEEWLVLRGRGVRTPGTGGFQQYVGHAQQLTRMPEYSGAAFSWGDNRIMDIANAAATSGNSETWISISVNHHIELAVEQISNLDDV
jgi:hypothetical protein